MNADAMKALKPDTAQAGAGSSLRAPAASAVVAAAGAPVDLVALAELQVARQADAHLAESACSPQVTAMPAGSAGIGLARRLLDLVGRHVSASSARDSLGGIFTPARALRMVSK
jgi:hypothetical protein